MKNGFTLIELLAVIIILSVVLLITVMAVDSTLLTSKKNVSSIQQKNIEEAAKAYYLKEGMLFEDECVSVFKLLSKGYLEGEKVVNPETKEDMNGYVKITYSNNQYSYKYQEDTCEIYEPIVNPILGSTPTKDTNGNIMIGSAFKIKVNNNLEPLTFFVLSNDGEYVNLIAEQNITPTGRFDKEMNSGDEWYATENNNTLGPITAYEYLSNATKNWINIPIIEKLSYVDEGYIPGATYGYPSINTAKMADETYRTVIFSNAGSSNNSFENMRVRMPYYSEISVLCTTTSGSCPLWLVNYLYNDSTSEQYYNSSNGKVSSTTTNNGYWTLTTASGGPMVRYVSYKGNIGTLNPNANIVGIRPVITIPKKALLNEMK